MKNIVIIGAGYAGVLTAKKLEKKLKKDSDVSITIINKKSYHTMLTELHEVAANRVDEDSIRMELSEIFAHRNVKIIIDEVMNVDFDKQVIIGNNGDISYDYLVIGTGCRPTFFDVQGTSYIKTLWSYEDAVDLNYHINVMFRKACKLADEEERKKLLTFVIVGSGFTGIEMAGELAEYKIELCRQYHIDIDEVTIKVVEAGNTILPFYPKKLSDKVIKRLEKMGVDILLNRTVCDVNEQICKFDETTILDTYTVIWAAGIEGSELVSRIEDITKAGRGRFATNSYLQSVDRENVYVIGDNIHYIPEGESMPVPQMVENAEHSASLVAHNLVCDIKSGDKKEYKPSFSGSMVCVGSRWGVAYVGKKNPKQLTGFSAMFIKHFVNCIYFMQVLGLHKIWSYVKHEFFTVKHNRSIFGGHLSNAKSAPGFFAFPLRVLIGILWIASGLTKLPAVMDDWNNVFLMPPNPIDIKVETTTTSYENTNADATTSATAPATNEVETTVTNEEVVTEGESSATAPATQTPTPGTSEPKEEDKTEFEEFAESVASYTELSAGKALPVPEFIQNIMNWSYENFFWDEDGGFTTFAAVVQLSMIITEILVGLMFLAGLFTPIAAILAAVLTLIIYLSGWSYISIIIFGAASVACFFAGNVLGLDYYVLPWLDRRLRKWRFTKKWYLYFKHE